jgi:hypothetical protein
MLLFRVLAPLALCAAAASACAQEFPVKPVRVIVGPGPDIVADRPAEPRVKALHTGSVSDF